MRGYIVCNFYTLFFDFFTGCGYLGIMNTKFFWVLESIDSEQVEIRIYGLPAILFTVDEIFGEALTVIEAQTTLFEVPAWFVTEVSCNAPLTLNPGDSYYKWFYSFEVLTSPYYLDSWYFQRYFMPAGVHPSVSERQFSARLIYRATPIEGYRGYLSPNKNQSFAIGQNGEFTGKAAQLMSMGYDPVLYRKVADGPPDVYHRVLPGFNLDWHYEGGSVDLTDFVLDWQGNGAWQYESTLPVSTVPSYDGTNVWNISQEFSDAIEIDSGGLGYDFYYYLFLGGGALNSSGTVVQRTPFPDGGNFGSEGLVKILSLKSVPFRLPELGLEDIYD